MSLITLTSALSILYTVITAVAIFAAACCGSRLTATASRFYSRKYGMFWFLLAFNLGDWVNGVFNTFGAMPGGIVGDMIHKTWRLPGFWAVRVADLPVSWLPIGMCFYMYFLSQVLLVLYLLPQVGEWLHKLRRPLTLAAVGVGFGLKELHYRVASMAKAVAKRLLQLTDMLIVSPAEEVFKLSKKSDGSGVFLWLMAVGTAWLAISFSMCKEADRIFYRPSGAVAPCVIVFIVLSSTMIALLVPLVLKILSQPCFTLQHSTSSRQGSTSAGMIPAPNQAQEPRNPTDDWTAVTGEDLTGLHGLPINMLSLLATKVASEPLNALSGLSTTAYYLRRLSEKRENTNPDSSPAHAKAPAMKSELGSKIDSWPGYRHDMLFFDPTVKSESGSITVSELRVKVTAFVEEIIKIGDHLEGANDSIQLRPTGKWPVSSIVTNLIRPARTEGGTEVWRLNDLVRLESRCYEFEGNLRYWLHVWCSPMVQPKYVEEVNALLRQPMFCNGVLLEQQTFCTGVIVNCAPRWYPSWVYEQQTFRTGVIINPRTSFNPPSDVATTDVQWLSHL